MQKIARLAALALPLIALALIASPAVADKKKGGGGGGGEDRPADTEGPACDAAKSYLEGQADRCPSIAAKARSLSCGNQGDRQSIKEAANRCREKPEAKSPPAPAPPSTTPPAPGSPAPAPPPRGEDPKDDAQVCRASFRSFTAEIDKSNCKSCGKGGLISATHCKLELTGPLMARLCTVAFSGNNKPEKFEVPFQFGKANATMPIGCPGKN